MLPQKSVQVGSNGSGGRATAKSSAAQAPSLQTIALSPAALALLQTKYCNLLLLPPSSAAEAHALSLWCSVLETMPSLCCGKGPPSGVAPALSGVLAMRSLCPPPPSLSVRAPLSLSLSLSPCPPPPSLSLLLLLLLPRRCLVPRLPCRSAEAAPAATGGGAQGCCASDCA